MLGENQTQPTPAETAPTAASQPSLEERLLSVLSRLESAVTHPSPTVAAVESAVAPAVESVVENAVGIKPEAISKPVVAAIARSGDQPRTSELSLGPFSVTLGIRNIYISHDAGVAVLPVSWV